MRYLLDSHAFIWYVQNDKRLPINVSETISNKANTIYLSFASIWEMGIKNALGKLKLSENYSEFIQFTLRSRRIKPLEIQAEHIFAAVNFPLHHRDPFDRLLAAQSKMENIPVISNDAMLDKYGVERIW